MHFSVKYFQNVHDTVRDLLSKAAVEKNFKEGMRHDKDGFMDISWCRRKVVPDWEHLRKVIGKANTRKCISPTQFNHSSTRGHCILEFEVDNKKLGERGRLYLCDLAGAEPAGDVHYAQYKKTHRDNGMIDYEYIGRHSDHHKTTELQEQGKKINLSLSELTRFFRRLAELIKHKKFKPGTTDLPGCNAYFLGRYLKQTILQAHTYLIAAVRPEVKFENYTHSTLDFATNASIIQLAPKKPNAGKNSAQQKACKEQMDALRKQLRDANTENANLRGEGHDHEKHELELEKARKELALKVKEMEEHINENEDGGVAGEELQHQAEMYHSRGMIMAGVDDIPDCPYLENLDVDDFRNKRLFLPLRKKITLIGRNGDIRPLAFSVTNKHCTFRWNDGTEDGKGDNSAKRNTILLVGGLGKTYHNGRTVTVNQEIEIKPFDRIVMGDFMTMMRWKNHENTENTENKDKDTMLSAEAAFIEFQSIPSPTRARRRRRASSNFANASNTSLSITKRMTELAPVIEEVNGLFKLLNRSMLTCELTMKFEIDDTDPNATPSPVLRVQITRKDIQNSIPVVMEIFHFIKIHDLLQQELSHLYTAIHRNFHYSLPDRHRPFSLIYDTEFAVGSATMPLSSLWNVATGKILQADSKSCVIKSVLPPNDPVGALQYHWEIVACPKGIAPPPPGSAGSEDSLTISDLVGSDWQFKLIIEAANELEINFADVYCQYVFYGETFTTDVVQSSKALEQTIPFQYECIHGFETSTLEFVNYMQSESLQIKLVGKIRPQHLPKDEMGTTNSVIAHNVTNVFQVVEDLSESENPLSLNERDRAIQVIQDHKNLKTDIKSATVDALKVCKTVSQKRSIMSKALFGGTAKEISAFSHTSLSRSSSQRSLAKVRSLVKMVGQYRKKEHEVELEELLVKREKDLDAALQKSDLYQKLYQDATMAVSGFCDVDIDYRDEAVSEIQLAQHCIAEDVRLSAEEALLRASTKYEIATIMSEAMVNGTTSQDIQRVAKKSRLDGQDVDEQEKMLLKNEIESNTDLTHSQQTAALLALSTCKVMRQLEELRDAVFHRLTATQIGDSCLVLSEHESDLHGLRSELQQAREKNNDIKENKFDATAQQLAWRNKSRSYESDMTNKTKEWQHKMQIQEQKVGDLVKKLSRTEIQYKQGQQQMIEMQNRLDNKNDASDTKSAVLQEEAAAMNVRLESLIGNFSTINNEMSTGQQNVRVSMNLLATKAKERKDMALELDAIKGRADVTQDEVSNLHAQIRELTEKTRLQESDIETNKRKELNFTQKNQELVDQIKETKEIVATLRQENQNNENIAGALQNDQAVATHNIKRLQEEMLEQTALLETAKKELDTQSNLFVENEQTFKEKERKFTIQFDGMKQQYVLSQQELEHERIRHKKQTQSAAETHASQLNTQEQESIRTTHNKLSDMEVSLQQSESLKNQLNASLQTARSEIMEIDDKLTLTQTLNSEIKTKLNNIEIEAKEKAIQLQQYMVSDTEQKTKIVELETVHTSTIRSNTEIKTTNDIQRIELENQIRTLSASVETVALQHTQEMEALKTSQLRDTEALQAHHEVTIKALQAHHEVTIKDACQELENDNHTLKSEMEQKEIQYQHNLESSKTQYEKNALSKRQEIENQYRASQSKLEQIKAQHERDTESLRITHQHEIDTNHSKTKQDIERQTNTFQSKLSISITEIKNIKEEGKRELSILQDRIDKDTTRHKKDTDIARQEHDRELNDKNERLNQLEKISNELSKKYKQEKTELTLQLTELEVQLNDSIRDSESNASRIEPLNNQLEQQTRDISRLKDTLSTSNSKIGELQGKLESLKKHFDTTTSKYDTQKRESDRTRNSLRESQAQVTELRSEVSGLQSQVGEIPVHEAEVDRLRHRIEEGSKKQNTVIRELQQRAHEAENKATRTQEKMVEELTRQKMEHSRTKQELVNSTRQIETLQNESEQQIFNQEELHSKTLLESEEKIRKFQNENENNHRSMEQLRTEHHSQIMELQDRMTSDAEQYLLQERQHGDAKMDSMKRTADTIQREAEEMFQRSEQSWLTDRSRLRNEVETSRTTAQNAQKLLQKNMLDLERQAIAMDKIQGELRSEREAHTETNAALSEMRTLSVQAEAEKMKVHRLESEVRSFEKTSLKVHHLEQQLLETERALQEVTLQKLEVDTQLGNAMNTSRVDQLREKVGRLRDAVSNDASEKSNYNNYTLNMSNGRSSDGSGTGGGGGGPGHSQSAILDALSQDHSRALTSNGDLRRELAREQDSCSKANARLYEEREVASNKIKQLTTILRQAQETWDRERKDILDSKRQAELSKHEFESAAKLYSRISKDATNERNNALRTIEDQSKLLQKKSTELSETRSNMLSLRDENLSLSHQADILRTEVSQITHVTAVRKRATYELDQEMSSATNELRQSRNVYSNYLNHQNDELVGSNVGNVQYEKAGQHNNNNNSSGVGDRQRRDSMSIVREADDEIAAMRNFFGSRRTDRNNRRSGGRSSRTLAEEADAIAMEVRKRSVGEV